VRLTLELIRQLRRQLRQVTAAADQAVIGFSIYVIALSCHEMGCRLQATVVVHSCLENY